MRLSIAFLIVLLSLSSIQCKEDCENEKKCDLDPDPGMCFAAFRKYYYDKKDKKCKEFTWGGCGGVVPFDTMEECQNGCGCN